MTQSHDNTPVCDALINQTGEADVPALTAGPLKDIDTDFIVVCCSAWSNDGGFGFNYSFDGERFNNRDDAIKHGWKLRGSDDFNIGQVYGDDLVWFGWMGERHFEDDETMHDIADAIGLGFNPKWKGMKFSKATGRVLGFKAQGGAS